MKSLILSDLPNSLHELRERDLQGRVQAMGLRLVEAHDGSRSYVPPHDLLATALAELDCYAEALRVTEEALRLQNEVLAACASSLDDERHRYEGLLSLIPDGVLVTDGVGLIREVNPAAARLLGRRPYRMRGRSVLAFLPPETRLDFQRELSAGGLIETRRATLTVHGCNSFDATITVGQILDTAGERRIYWLVRPCAPVAPERSEGTSDYSAR